LSALVGIENVENIVCELSRIAEREELFVDATELGLVEMTRRTVFLEALVPEERSDRCIRKKRQDAPLLELFLIN